MTMTRAIVILVVLAAALSADDPKLVVDSGGHRDLPKNLIFTRDGKFLISAGDDGVVRIWDIASGKTVRKILGKIDDGVDGLIYAAALSPDERYLAVGGWLSSDADYGAIRIHDFHTGEVLALLKGHTNTVHSLAFSPDGRWLASSSSDRTVKIWDATGWKLIHTLSGHQDDVNAVAFSPDGKMVVSGSYDKNLRLWDRSTGHLLKEMTGNQSNVFTVAFSPDGAYIASGSRDGIVKLWDGHSGALVRNLAAQESVVPKLAFSPDSRLLLTAAGGNNALCHVIEVSTGRNVAQFQATNSVVGVAFSPDGKMVATGGGDQSEIFIWNPENGDVVRRLSGNGSSIWAVGFGRRRKIDRVGPNQKAHLQRSGSARENRFARSGTGIEGYL